MGSSTSSLLDEAKCNYIRGRTEAELNNFSPHYRRQHCVAFFSKLRDEVEQQQTVHTQLLKQKDPPQASELIYKEKVLHFDDSRKWKERFVVVRADYSLELHDSQETFTKGLPARHSLQLSGGTVLTSQEKYCALVDKAFPDLNSSKEEAASPPLSVPGPFAVYLRLPYTRDVYFSFQEEDQQIRFVSILSDCVRHQNHDCLRTSACEAQAFLKAIYFYRQEKGHYESWEMLVGNDCQVMANLVMEELLPSLQTELLPRLKGKKADRKRVWFTTVKVAYELVQEQLSDGLRKLKEECSEAVKQQEALIRSDMDQIINSCNFLQTKLQGLVSDPALKFCSESVSPYLASILEELMGPVSSGFEAVRQRLEGELSRICKDFQSGGTLEGLTKALEDISHTQLEDCYQRVSVLKEQLHELRTRFRFSNSTLVVHNTQSHMQQLMENAVYTFEMLLQSAVKDRPEELGSVMEKAKLRVLKQYDYDSSTIRKKIFQEALVDITLPAIRRNLAPSCKTELQNFEQYIFADYTNFIQVENVYEDILLNILNAEVNKVVKEAATLKKHNLFVDSTELQCVSQSSLSDSRTPPQTSQSSLTRAPASAGTKQTAEQKSGGSENPATEEEKNQEVMDVEAAKPAAVPDVASSVPVCPSEVASADRPDVVSSSDKQGGAQSDAGTDLNTSPKIIISEPVSPAEDEETADPAVHLTEPLEVQITDEMETDAPAPHSEIDEAEAAPTDEPCISAVQPDADEAEDASDSQTETPSCPSPTPDVSEASTELSTTETTNGLPCSSDPPLGSDVSSQSVPTESNGTPDLSDPEGQLDSVKAIRDLVVELIEVEDIVSPCPEHRNTQ
ncbi:protein Niban 1 [Trichomycterus rosablanca]|uniref:protein Niban 1 n=1 Tax=Trichomycterus rosablanca TaxID=2290929 RepID=UPI002F3596CD